MYDLNPWWIAGIATISLSIATALWLRHFARTVQIERARELFRLQHERFEDLLLDAASKTGKPRGLTWIGIEIIGVAVLARNARRGIVALVPVVIRFEPIAGSEMEDVLAAREPRTATAIFAFVRGHWHTDGRIVFNLNPAQMLSNASTGFTRMEARHH